MKGKIIFITGITTAGKTTIGKLLVKNLTNSVFLDQDEFFKFHKPMIDYIGTMVTNWDSDESIDFHALKLKILQLQKEYDYVIVAGFALKRNLVCIKPDFGILLSLNMSDQDAQEQIIKTRRVTKNYNTIEKIKKDEWMVKNVVYPYYLKTISDIDYNVIIDVYKDGKHVPLDYIINKILTYI